MNNFVKKNAGLFTFGIMCIPVSYIVYLLYDLSRELTLYLLFFEILFWLIGLCIQARIYKKELASKEDEVIYEPDIQDEKWEKVKEKEDFFTLWAHQIKTPIAALNLLLQSENPDLFECKNETFKIESYVEMALSYFRFENLSNDLVLTSYNLEDMVRSTVKKHATVFIHKHLSVKIENVDYKILTDDKWFSFVLDQVLSNALKYTKEGGITISATSENGKVLLNIKDTGIGIRAEDLPRLFSKGFTGYNGRMDKKASGLGLYLCKGICDKLGHSISLESKENEGTTVTITINEEKIESDDLTKM